MSGGDTAVLLRNVKKKNINDTIRNITNVSIIFFPQSFRYLIVNINAFFVPKVIISANTLLKGSCKMGEALLLYVHGTVVYGNEHLAVFILARYIGFFTLLIYSFIDHLMFTVITHI